MISNRSLWAWSENDTRGPERNLFSRQFIRESKDEAVTIANKIIVVENAYEAICMVKSFLDRPFDNISGDFPDSYYICGNYKGSAVLVSISKLSSYRNDEEDESPASEGTNQSKVERDTKAFILDIQLTGPYILINDLMAVIKSTLTIYKASVVRWWYKNGNHNTWYTREIFLEAPKTTLHPALYPTFKEDPHTFLKRYLASNESLLLITGEPGTGKTTLLRHLINDFDLHADILYDEDGIKSDYVFQQWLFDKESTVLIVEDADSALRKREEYNPLMARFLNMAEGLILFPNKKLVFTSNLTKPNKIDEALTRPGRCFGGVIRIRSLTLKEAKNACKAMGWVEPKEDKDYTLAELAHNRSNEPQERVGYVK